MYPIIHDFKADNLTSRGYGALIDCISADVSEELNGGFTLEIKYPLHGTRAEYLIPDNIIVAKPSHDQPPQAFRISQVKRSLTNSITVYANHISYDLSGYLTRTARSFSSLADTIAYMNTLDWSSQAGDAVYHQFSFDTDMSSNAVFRTDGLQSLKSWMGGHEGSLIDIYGGEWAYDNFNCSLKERRGEDTGIRVSYGKNLAEYVKEQTNSLFSHVVAYWAKNDITVCSDFVSVGAGSPFKAVYYNATDKYESQPTVAQLNTIAATQKPNESQTITVTPAQIGDVIGLGDTVYICYENVFTTRVIKTVWNVLADNYTKLELGTKKANIAETIKSLSTAPSGENGYVDPSADYVLEEGTSSDWYYRKWNGGKYECWYRSPSNESVACTSAWGSTLHYGTIATINFPITFIDYPVMSVTVQAGAGGCWAAPDYPSKSQTGPIYMYRPTSSTVNCRVNVYACGRWK